MLEPYQFLFRRPDGLEVALGQRGRGVVIMPAEEEIERDLHIGDLFGTDRREAVRRSRKSRRTPCPT